MITATFCIVPGPDEDAYGSNEYRLNERELRGRVAYIPAGIDKVIIDIGQAKYPLIFPDDIRTKLPENVEVIGSNPDGVRAIAEQLGRPRDPRLDCDDCVDWLPCATHMVSA